MQFRRNLISLKQLEYEKEGEKRIKLREIEDQILKLNNVDGNRVGEHVELSTEEKVYRNDIVSKTFKKVT